MVSSSPMAVLSPELLREARGTKGLTQEQVARQIGVTLRTIARVEIGEGGLSVPTLLRLARLYERPMESFFVCEGDGEACCAAAHPSSGGAAVETEVEA
jgi:transcriptional regulator with XRE-family HTH domain